MTRSERELVLEPVTGKALPLLRGERLRVEQLGDGQCVDLNVFNLHDRKERFDAARTRMMHGVRPTTGAMLWSNAPRGRPLLSIIEDTVGLNDIVFPACSSFEYEHFARFEGHTNCQDILAEAAREYGLKPEDVHDPFNIWLEAGVGADGMLWSRPVAARRGDSIAFLAQVDVLAVLSVCGDDLFGSSQFEMKPVQVVVSPADADIHLRWLQSSDADQPGPSSAQQAGTKAGLVLERDPSFQPRWSGYPVQTREIEVDLPDSARDQLDDLRRLRRLGSSDGEIVRSILFHWWQEAEVDRAARRASG